MKRALSWVILGTVVIGLLAVVLRGFGSPVLGWFLLVLAVGGGVAALRLLERTLRRRGLPTTARYSIVALVALGAIVIVKYDLRHPKLRSPYEDIDYGKNIAVTDVRVVQNVPDCPNRCIAGTVTNTGDRAVAAVHLRLTCLTTEGKPLEGGAITTVPLDPPGALQAGAHATFLYVPIYGFAAIDPRFTRAEAESSVVEFPDPSLLRHALGALFAWAGAHGRDPLRPKETWYSPLETQEYAKQVVVTATLTDAGGGRYQADGTIENGGDLPLHDVAVALEARDKTGILYAGVVREIVHDDYEHRDGPFAPLAPHGMRPFSEQLTPNEFADPKPGPPVILEARLASLNLGRKSRK